MRWLLVTLALALAACGESKPKAEADPSIVTIDKRYWVCTSTHTAHHAAVELGNAKTIRREFPAYDTADCDQWSATFTKPWPICPATNAWCQGTKPR
jgi:hypothetical protein